MTAGLTAFRMDGEDQPNYLDPAWLAQQAAKQKRSGRAKSPAPQQRDLASSDTSGDEGFESADEADAASPATSASSADFEVTWYYRGAQGEIQGPWSLANMQSWFEHEFLPKGTMVRRGGATRADGSGAPFRDVFEFQEITSTAEFVAEGVEEDKEEEEEEVPLRAVAKVSQRTPQPTPQPQPQPEPEPELEISTVAGRDRVSTAELMPLESIQSGVEWSRLVAAAEGAPKVSLASGLDDDDGALEDEEEEEEEEYSGGGTAAAPAPAAVPTPASRPAPAPALMPALPAPAAAASSREASTSRSQPSHSEAMHTPTAYSPANSTALIATLESMLYQEVQAGTAAQKMLLMQRSKCDVLVRDLSEERSTVAALEERLAEQDAVSTALYLYYGL